VRRALTAALAGLIAAATVSGGGYAAAAWTGHEPAAEVVPMGPGEVTVEIDIEHSRFSPDTLAVVPGTRVRFVVVNGDPIGHELITGGPDVHARHARGTEATHLSVPGEVSVGPTETGVTTFRFTEPGQYEFACHLPNHYEYGMKGTIEVVPRRTIVRNDPA
jgi:uncharacterized cupredoxin-like copper-binding protein